MEIQRFDGAEESAVLISMITDDRVLGRIEPKWGHGLFSSKYSNIIGSWCIGYYRSYSRAPGKTIRALFEGYAETVKDKATVSLIESFLSQLGDSYKQLKEESNSEFAIDRAAKHFDKVQIKKAYELSQAYLEAGDLAKARKVLEGYRKIELGAGSTIDVFQDKEALKRAFESKREPLIRYPGAAGEFFGDALERDGFLSIYGLYKSGKSYWLSDICYRGVTQRRKVAMFQAGDLSEAQFMQRWACRSASRPLFAKTVKYPKSIIKEKDAEEARVEYDEKVFKNDLSWRSTWKAYQKIQQRRVRSDESYFKLSVHANSTLSIGMIQDSLKRWEREDWTPDIIAVDYPDIMDMSSEDGDLRSKTNEIWKKLRSISQIYHCLVIVVTQVKASAMKAVSLGQEHFSEDARKLAHVTGTLGVSQTSTEKDHGIYRLNWINLREGAFSRNRFLYVAGCLDIASPIICSTW
jgi:hypothetical protein